jgi:threonine synthase
VSYATTVNPFVKGLKCRVCGKSSESQAINFCTDDFGPLEVEYDYESVREALSREKV